MYISVILAALPSQIMTSWILQGYGISGFPVGCQANRVRIKKRKTPTDKDLCISTFFEIRTDCLDAKIKFLCPLLARQGVHL